MSGVAGCWTRGRDGGARSAPADGHSSSCLQHTVELGGRTPDELVTVGAARNYGELDGHKTPNEGCCE
jgi:hypothetical protein